MAPSAVSIPARGGDGAGGAVYYGRLRADDDGRDADGSALRHVSPRTRTLEVPAERWTHRVAPAYRDVAPRTVTLADGADATVVGDLPPRQNPMDLYGGKGRDVWKPFGQRYEDTPGTGSPEQRLREQDLDGTSAEVLFPAVVVGPRYWSKLPDPRAVQAIFRGWNDWLGEEYCAYAPERLFGVGAIPPTGVDAAVAEVQRCAELGLRAVMLTTFPNGGVRRCRRTTASGRRP